ncbi:MAG: NAD(P)/FAD-dependent oxidoreductase, partial [Usitatibacter sp.]
ENFHPERQIHITLVEAGPRILPGLPDHIAEGTVKVLEDLAIDVFTGERVTEVSAKRVKTATGREIPADFTVWAAGIRCNDVLKDLDGLESNRINQLVVKPTLDTTRDPDVFAIGDCAACPWKDGRDLPPRAQTAHQEASHMVETVRRRLAGVPPKPFRYRDFGSLVSLGHYDTVGQLMGFISSEKFRVEGWLAKLFYLSLYRQHIWALSGFWRMALDTLARWIRRQNEPKVKLH